MLPAAAIAANSEFGSVQMIAVVQDERLVSKTIVFQIVDTPTGGDEYRTYGSIMVSGTGEQSTTVTHIPEGNYTYTVVDTGPNAKASPNTGAFVITAEQTTEVRFKFFIPVNSYTVKFVDDDESHTVLQSGDVEEGKSPVYTESAPIKPADAQYTYAFAGWTDGTNTYGKDETFPAVTGTVTYTAVYTATKNKYTITWVQDDGSVIDTTTVEYGDTPTHADPEKGADAEFTYTFSGWSPGIVSVTGDKTYTATYANSKNEYSVTFKNEDGTVLEIVTAAYGETPEYTGETPAKAEDADNTYEFAGWDREIAAVAGDAEYTATFTAVQKIPSPATGSDSFETWAVLMLTSLACLGAVLLYGRKRAKAK